MASHLAVPLLLALALASPGPQAGKAERLVRRALEVRYAKLAEALESEDFEAFQALRTSDFSTVDFEGHKQSAEEMAARARGLFELVEPPIRVSFKLGAIDLKGSEAKVTVRQSFSRMQEVAARRRKVETNVTQDETWVSTTEGWKLKFVEGERQLAWYVDGKRIEPGKPYDPEAPAYVPPR